MQEFTDTFKEFLERLNIQRKEEEKLIFEEAARQEEEKRIAKEKEAAELEDSDSLMEEIDLFLASDDSMPPGIEDDDYDSEGDIHFLEELLSSDSPPVRKMIHSLLIILMIRLFPVLLRNHRMLRFALILSPMRVQRIENEAKTVFSGDFSMVVLHLSRSKRSREYSSITPLERARNYESNGKMYCSSPRLQDTSVDRVTG
ncbi:hypothetical protein Tco_0509440 [Tanacetum coccineum]